MTFALFFETSLAAFLAFCPGLDKGLRMYPLQYVAFCIRFTLCPIILSCKVNVNIVPINFCFHILDQIYISIAAVL